MRSRGRGGRTVGLLALTGVSVLGSPAVARGSDSDKAASEARASIATAMKGVASIEQAIRTAQPDERSPEARIADGEILLRSKEYQRAAGVLNQVLERFAGHPTAYPDAMFLLGQTYFESKQYLSARRIYRQMIERTHERGFAVYQSRALAGLIDVALRTGDYASLDDAFARINQLPPASIEAELSYARAKGLFAKKDYAGAKRALAAIDPASPRHHQARYLLGVVTMKEAAPPPASRDKRGAGAQAKILYAAAIEAFRQVTLLPADSPEHQHVIDLAWLAIGRLLYETDQFAQAADAYNHVERGSPEWSTMLYELAWAFVRLGDSERALRSLEILAISDPNNPYMADATLLRADLMLRSGQFDKSLKLYQEARAQFDPMRDKMEAFLASTSDPAVYFERLSSDGDGIERADALPALAIRWAREAEDGAAAFAVIDGIKECRELLKQSNAFIDRIGSVLETPNRVRAFPELKAGEERALALLNTITLARRKLAEGLDAEEPSSVSGELSRVRDERQKLQQRVLGLPVTESDFAAREADARQRWNGVSQKVQQLTLQVDQLQAIVNGLRRALTEGPIRGVVRDPASIKRFEAELAQNEADIGIYKTQMSDLRRFIETSRLQVGFGDQRFVEDREVRKAFARALSLEVRLDGAGAAGGDAAAYARRVEPILAEADAADARLEGAFADLEARVAKRTAELRATLEVEAAKITESTRVLEGLDSEGRLVVGQVAMRNFQVVRDRLKNIVLRADVGITEEAWELREEELARVRNLQLERSQSEQQLNEELREVLDDMGEAEKPAAAGGSQK